MNQLKQKIVEALRKHNHPDLAGALADETMPLVAQHAKNGDTILYDNEWLQMRETPDGYVYSHEAKSDGLGVAVLAYRRVGDDIQVAGRYERTPCHRDGIALTSLTGLVDKAGEDPVGTAVRELKEEAGIDAIRSEMQPLGEVRPSKQADTVMHLFAIDVGDRDIGKAVGDGTAGEADAYCKWVTLTDACLSKSPVLAALLVRTFISDLVR